MNVVSDLSFDNNKQDSNFFSKPQKFKFGQVRLIQTELSDSDLAECGLYLQVPAGQESFADKISNTSNIANTNKIWNDFDPILRKIPLEFEANDEGGWSKFFEVLKNWKEVLNSDFDGELPAAWAVNFLEELAKNFRISEVSAPELYFSSDGEIGARWLNDLVRASVSITSDGQFSAFAQKSKLSTLRIRSIEEWFQCVDKFLSIIS